MEVRWSPEAADELAAIVAYIREDDHSAAQRTAVEIYHGAGALTTFDHRLITFGLSDLPCSLFKCSRYIFHASRISESLGLSELNATSIMLSASTRAFATAFARFAMSALRIAI